MTGFNASAFRSKLKDGGARANLFEVTMTFPGEAGGASEMFTFMCRSASLPGMTVGQIAVPYFGRTIKLAGDRTFEDWNVRVFNDEDFLVRNAFEAWQNRFAMLDNTTSAIENATSVGGQDRLYVDITVNQLSRKGDGRPGGPILKSYTLKNAHPTNLGSIELAWDSNDAIEEFDVVIAYDYFVTNKIEGMKVQV